MVCVCHALAVACKSPVSCMEEYLWPCPHLVYKWCSELRLCWSWWMWRSLRELGIHLSPHPPASQALGTPPQ